jgi:hypothetical protein
MLEQLCRNAMNCVLTHNCTLPGDRQALLYRAFIAMGSTFMHNSRASGSPAG